MTAVLEYLANILDYFMLKFVERRIELVVFDFFGLFCCRDIAEK